MKSIVSHEGGTKHFANAQRRLAEMRRRGAAAAGAKRQEDEWVKQMEEAALKDYRRDILHFTSKLEAPNFYLWQQVYMLHFSLSQSSLTHEFRKAIRRKQEGNVLQNLQRQ